MFASDDALKSRRNSAIVPCRRRLDHQRMTTNSALLGFGVFSGCFVIPMMICTAIKPCCWPVAKSLKMITLAIVKGKTRKGKKAKARMGLFGNHDCSHDGTHSCVALLPNTGNNKEMKHDFKASRQ